MKTFQEWINDRDEILEEALLGGIKNAWQKAKQLWDSLSGKIDPKDPAATIQAIYSDPQLEPVAKYIDQAVQKLSGNPKIAAVIDKLVRGKGQTNQPAVAEAVDPAVAADAAQTLGNMGTLAEGVAWMIGAFLLAFLALTTKRVLSAVVATVKDVKKRKK